LTKLYGGTGPTYLKIMRSPICLVALANGRIVGMARGRENYLINLFVDGKFHGRGIGSKLLDRYEQRCLALAHHDLQPA